MSEPTRSVGFCPHCSNRAPQELVHTQPAREPFFNSDGSLGSEEFTTTYVAVCESCHQVLLYWEVDDVPHGAFTQTNLLYPKDGTLDRKVPARIRDIYHEAFRIRYLAPNAYATQIRKALEAIVEDRGASGGSLHEKLKDLAGRSEMPPVLAEMSDVLRLLGNLGAHPGVNDVRPGFVMVIEDFFRALIEYVYVAPGKVQEFRKRLSDLKASGDTGDAAE